MCLSFKFLLSAAHTGHVILRLNNNLNLKFTLVRPKRPTAKGDVQLYTSFKLNAIWDGRSSPRISDLTTGREPEPFLQEDGQAPGPVSMGFENLTSTANRSPYCPSHSKLFYKRCYSNILIKTQKFKYNFQTILTAVRCTSNSLFFALCTAYSA